MQKELREVQFAHHMTAVLALIAITTAGIIL
jgi:hypothetical protein